jgi:hypothetical protein
MKTDLQLAEEFRAALEHPTHGILGIVDDMLKMCRGRTLELAWVQDDGGIRTVVNGSELSVASVVRKSVFRAILARVAALCNEGIADSVSPYGGQGRLPIGTNPDWSFHVSFANTPDEQWLKLTPNSGSDRDTADAESVGDPDKRPIGLIGESAVYGHGPLAEPTVGG